MMLMKSVMRIWIDGVEQSITITGNNPSAINNSSADLYIGASDAGGQDLLDGVVRYIAIAKGVQPFLEGGSSDRDEPLEDIISEWHFHGFYEDGGT